MGYCSYGRGDFRARENINEQDLKVAIEYLENNEEFSIFKIKNRENTYSIGFDCWKLYYAKGAFEKLAKYFDGEFEIHGEEWGDIWYLKLENGKFLSAPVKIIKQEYGRDILPWDYKW